MLNTPKKVTDAGKKFVKKVISKRNDIPHIAAKKTKDAIRPYYRKSKSVREKSAYAMRLAMSSSARQLHKMISRARSYDRDGEWEQSKVAWQGVIDVFGRDAPVEAYVKLSRAYQQLQDYDKALEVTNLGMALFPRDPENVIQQDLLDLLALSKEKADLSVVVRLNNIDEYKSSIEAYKKAVRKRDPKAPKIAVVSAVSNGYDAFRPPAIIDERFDYIVYSDTVVQNPGIYDVRLLPYIDFDSTRSARFVKTNITNLLPEYDYVMWIDANIMMVGDIYPIFDEFMKSGKEFGAMLHPTRTSPYEEMEECIRAGKDDIDAITEQRDYYRSQGYDTDKLIESNILLYNLNGKNIDTFMNMWWNQIDKYSRRDQFSINYCLDMAAVDWTTFMGGRPNCSRNHEAFALVDHGIGNGRFRRLIRELDSRGVDPYIEGGYSSQEINNPIKSVTAIVCVHNALEEVTKCLDSLKKYKADNLDVIIVDDGSADDTRDYLAKFARDYSQWVRRIRHESAQGYTRAATAGLKASKADLSVLLNSDTIVTKNWSEKMSRALESNKGAGIVGPMSSAASHQSVPNHKSTVDQTAINVLPDGVSIDEMNQYCEQWSSGTTRPLVPLVHGFCFGVRREVLETIGYLDHEHFPRGYGEENDFCFRAANAGFKLVIATDTYVFHAKSKSFVSEERKQLMDQGARAFRDLHGQRRITRAVRAMEENPILQSMRDKANDLYVKKELRNNDSEHAVFLPPSVPTLRGLSYEDLQATLVKLNDKLIDWNKLTKKQTSSSVPKVSIVVLVLNHLDMTVRCVESILNARTEIDYELLVVNNGSQIETLQGLRQLKAAHPQIKLINVEQNLNFALGNNVACNFVEGKYSVFINNDTFVTNHWLDKLVQPLIDKSAAITQSFLLYPDGDVQSAGVVFTAKSHMGYALYAGRSPEDDNIRQDRELQAVTGACLAIATKDFAKLKGFDPSYINGQEDVDLCLRLRRLPGRSNDAIRVVAQSLVYHDESKTPGRGKYRYENRVLFKSRWKEHIVEDDLAIYDADGYDPVKWLADSTEGVERGVPIYTPKLKSK